MPFSLTDKTIDVAALAKGLHDDGVGAVVTFEGRVRDANQGRPVKALEYESYDALVEKEGEKILGEAGAGIRHPARGLRPPHRQARHRRRRGLGRGRRRASDAAFAACRFVIDEIKTRVPLWKKEHYADGSSEWLNSAGQAVARAWRRRPNPYRVGMANDDYLSMAVREFRRLKSLADKAIAQIQPTAFSSVRARATIPSPSS